MIIEQEATALWNGGISATGSSKNPLGGTNPGKGVDWVAAQGAAFSVTAKRVVALDVPGYTSSRPTGVVELNTFNYVYPNQLVLAAGGGNSSAPIVEQANGITFQDTVLTPSLYSSKGTWYHVQLISVSRYETPTGSSTPIGSMGNGVAGALDAQPNIFIYDYTFPADGTAGSPDNDNPSLGVYEPYQNYKVNNEAFQDYIMYTPPGTDSIAVPLAYYTWQWYVNVTKPDVPLPKSWTNWKDAPTNGTITTAPANYANRQLIYPTWSSRRNLAWSTP